MKDASILPGWPMALRREKAAAYLDVSPSKLDEMLKDNPAFPRPIVLHGSVKAWHRGDLDAFLEDRRAAAAEEHVANLAPAETWAAP